mmetsp:Transcript_5134/g.12719  ORF Transcript_5134/g.12719 Transcript_5134/m.12719 type:complete len:393 (-) Transcript_5134:818-1996(-)
MNQVQHVPEGAHRLRRHHRERREERGLRRGVGLRDHAVVLVRVHAECGEQEVRSLRLESLVQAKHVDTEHVLSMVRHIRQPHRRAAASQKHVVLGGNHRLQRRGHLGLSNGGRRHAQVDLAPPPMQGDQQGRGVGAVNAHALVFHQEFQQRQDLHRAVDVPVLPVLSILAVLSRPSICSHGLRCLERWLLTLHVFCVGALLRLVLRDLCKRILNELPSVPKILGDLLARLGIHAYQQVHSLIDPIRFHLRLPLEHGLPVPHLPQQGHEILAELHDVDTLPHFQGQLEGLQSDHHVDSGHLAAGTAVYSVQEVVQVHLLQGSLKVVAQCKRAVRLAGFGCCCSSCLLLADALHVRGLQQIVVGVQLEALGQDVHIHVRRGTEQPDRSAVHLSD